MKTFARATSAVLTIALVSTLGAVGLPVRPANAQAVSADCKVRPLTGITEGGGNVSVKIYIAPNCPNQAVTLAVYKTTAQIFPVSTQKLYSYVSSSYGSGEHTLTTPLPDNCYYQADLMSGQPVTQLQDNVAYDVLYWRLGGSKDCVTPPPVIPPVTPPVTPPVVPPVVTPPSNTNNNTNSNVNTVNVSGSSTPAANATTAAYTSTSSSGQVAGAGQTAGAQSYTSPGKPSILPVTGPGGLAGLFAGVSLTSGLGYSIINRLRSRE